MIRTLRCHPSDLHILEAVAETRLGPCRTDTLPSYTNVRLKEPVDNDQVHPCERSLLASVREKGLPAAGITGITRHVLHAARRVLSRPLFSRRPCLLVFHFYSSTTVVVPRPWHTILAGAIGVLSREGVPRMQLTGGCCCCCC